MMETSIYRNDATNGLAMVYDPQSSPASVDSTGSTDAGLLTGYEAFEKNYLYLKSTKHQPALPPYSPASYLPQTKAKIVPPSSLELPPSGAVESVALTTPEVINMLKDDVNQFDQIIPEYSLGAAPDDSHQLCAEGSVQNDTFVQESESLRNSFTLSIEEQRRLAASPSRQSVHSMSPIDMEQQEIIKTERKRLRNRIAASKCRKRKLERISRLEEKVTCLKQQNVELSANANVLRQQVAELKTKVMSHVSSGCHLMVTQQHQQLVF